MPLTRCETNLLSAVPIGRETSRFHRRQSLTMSELGTKPAADVPEAQIAAMLECRYGDGMVYLPRGTPGGILDAARQHGFVDAEGYLTRKGRALLARYHFA